MCAHCRRQHCHIFVCLLSLWEQELLDLVHQLIQLLFLVAMLQFEPENMWAVSTFKSLKGDRRLCRFLLKRLVVQKLE